MRVEIQLMCKDVYTTREQVANDECGVESRVACASLSPNMHLLGTGRPSFSLMENWNDIGSAGSIVRGTLDRRLNSLTAGTFTPWRDCGQCLVNVDKHFITVWWGDTVQRKAQIIIHTHIDI